MVFGVFFCVLGLLGKRKRKEERADPNKRALEKNNEETDNKTCYSLYRRRRETSFFFCNIVSRKAAGDRFLHVLVSAGISVQ